MNTNNKEDRHFVTALARGLEVLACFRSADKTLGNNDIAQRCQLPKSTVSRLTYTLTKLGYLNYLPQQGKYALGSATLSLGSAMIARMDVRQLARPLMQELADFSQGMVSLGMRDKLSMIYIENCRSQTALTLSLDVGSRIPVASTAMGRAFIAQLSPPNQQQVLADIAAADPARWPLLETEIDYALQEYATLGCCTSFGQWQPEVNAIAVAFSPGPGLMPMAINCGGPSFVLKKEFLMEEVRPRLRELVTQLQNHLR